MKLKLSDEWCLAAADREGDREVGAGFVAFDPIPNQAVQAEPLIDRTTEATHLALGRLVNLLRRQHSYTIERLALQARVDIDELLMIEKDYEFQPEPRTVHQLAEVFHLQPRALQLLAGSSKPRDELFKEVVKFAASSEPVAKLTKEEATAVEHFVAVLTKWAEKESP
jgi:hypothetical protein